MTSQQESKLRPGSKEWMARLPVVTQVVPPTVELDFVLPEDQPAADASALHPLSPIASAVQSIGAAGPRLIRLLEYVHEAERLGRRSNHHLPGQSGFCAWDHELRDLPGVTLGDSAAQGVWMRIERLQELGAPAMPDALDGWVQPSSNDIEPPRLLPVMHNPISGQSALLQELDPVLRQQLTSLFDAYLQNWNSWLLMEARRRNTMALYAKLFALQQSLESETSASPLDVVWGVGIASWKHDSRTSTRYPLLTKLVEISLDTNSLALEVRPREADPRLELDPFSEIGNSGVAQVELLSRTLMHHDNFEFSPFATATLEPVLRSAVSHFDAHGVYLPDDPIWRAGQRKPAECGEHLKVSNGWVLFTRARGANFLLDDLKKLQHALTTTPVPGGPAALVMEPSSEVDSRQAIQFRGLSQTIALSDNPERAPTDALARELYFTKPYNDEQVQIVDRLERFDGVVVQGPPGTGKTHTIANVISHYLATGRTVLVTSKGEPALAVLRDHIPAGIRDLSVSLLANERDGMQQFEAAIGRISTEVARLEPQVLQTRIQEHEVKVDILHGRLAEIDDAMRDIAANHLQGVELDGHTYTALELSEFILAGAPQNDWIEPIAWENRSDQQIDESLLQAASRARLLLGDQITESQPHVDMPNLTSIESLSACHRDLKVMRNINRDLRSLDLRACVAPDISVADLSLISITFQAAHDRLSPLHKSKGPFDWTTHLLTLVTNEDAQDNITLLQSTLAQIKATFKERKIFVERPVKTPIPDVAQHAVFHRAITTLSGGGNPFPWWSLKMRKIRTLTQAITISDNPAVSTVDWLHVSAYFDYLHNTTETVARWNSVADELNLPSIDGIHDLKPLVEIYNHCSAVLDAGALISSLLEMKAHILFNVSISAWLEPATWLTWRQYALLYIQKLNLSASTATRDDLLNWSQSQPPGVRETIEAFTSQCLGSDAVDPEALQSEWSFCLFEVQAASDRYEAALAIGHAAEALQRAQAPQWAQALASEPLTAGDLDPWCTATWRDAWTWSRARDWLSCIDSRGELREFQNERRRLEDSLASAYLSLVEARTWMGLVTNATPAVRSALNAYMNAIRLLGKGTGVRAQRYRKEARDAMAKAYRAVPCWILPHWRVSEALPAEIGTFDLVVIDEASQSDLWALPAMLRGKKIMIVGDDQQVSPDGIGLDEEKIGDLYQRYLSDQVFGSQMTPEKSIYDLARVAFAGSQVMLREHFRCVPQIIDFSNKEFYNGEIRALRLPHHSQRRSAALIDLHVKNGLRETGEKINRAEARAIVDQIKSICADPGLLGRTIGVVSLLGGEQAQLIDFMIRKEIDAREIVDRHIACGDARVFQGKERDIIMLSLVIDPRTTVAATRRDFQQRYNVAASRARDQMYLFRSVALSDLNPLDLRAKLMLHFQDINDQDVSLLPATSAQCQTSFEAQLFDTLNSLGYRVRTQVTVGSLCIDLVVEGRGDARLAIECDGDRNQHSNQWDVDMRRQRVLERAGWVFWRCFAATYSLRAHECIADLMRVLSQMKIEPMGSHGQQDARLKNARELREITVD